MIDVAKYRSMGYTDAQIQEAWNEVAAESQQQPSQAAQSYSRLMNQNQYASNQSNTLVAGQANQENLIKWQLELDSILERIEHILRGDRPKMENGNMIFVPTQDDKDKFFNDYGVAEIMRLLSMYLNRNTILSNYDEDTILWKVLDFGKEVSDLIFLKYEDMGLDTLEKRKRYPMLVREIVDSVHSAYLRALNGGERDSLRTARSVNQNQPLPSYDQNGMAMPMQQKRSLFNPGSWLR